MDINQNNGLGKVVTKRQKLLQGIELHKPMMQACRHSNGTDWWLLKQENMIRIEFTDFW
ncbi:MAG: hypothetical protein IPO02_13465 [Bacteroidetes bacterium]|nr:hypothetical protein [Bacteroidota bacterium]